MDGWELTDKNPVIISNGYDRYAIDDYEIWIELIWYESVDINGNKKLMIWVMNDENDIPVIVFSNIE